MGMIKKTKRILFGFLVLIFIFFAINASQNLYDVALDVTPSFIRSSYIEYILIDDENEQGSDHLKVMLLRHLLKHPHKFDTKTLILLCERDGKYMEPIPQLATRVLITEYPEDLPALLKYYKNDDYTLRLIKKKQEQISTENFR
ncbi:hypothetical protein [uncultured Shewanella sp.]|uniref:hypothetical protein n=1 Tax=uncultured Shewanella sp. TaxID=173975 RepID=UPI002602BE73|nr:hypothetical protein [uncultured Shewanella sp.]